MLNLCNKLDDLSGCSRAFWGSSVVRWTAARLAVDLQGVRFGRRVWVLIKIRPFLHH